LLRAGRNADREDMGPAAEISTLDVLVSLKNDKNSLKRVKRAFLGLKYDYSRLICCLSSY
jgi:hypothetical protein